MPGLYKWGTGVSINTDVTLSGYNLHIVSGSGSASGHHATP